MYSIFLRRFTNDSNVTAGFLTDNVNECRVTSRRYTKRTRLTKLVYSLCAQEQNNYFDAISRVLKIHWC